MQRRKAFSMGSTKIVLASSFGIAAGSDIELTDALRSVLDGISSSLIILLP